MSTRRARQRGVTLIELILFIVIVSVAVAGVLQALRISTAGSADPLRRKQALMIAEGLLEEVQLARFAYCDPASDNAENASGSAACTIPEGYGQGGGSGAAQEPVGPRPFDNVNDYVAAMASCRRAFDTAASSATPAAADGAAHTVRLATAGAGGRAPNTGADVGDVLRISVIVSYDDQTLVDGYRTHTRRTFNDVDRSAGGGFTLVEAVIVMSSSA
jgi:MSHA pilin protein MshD